MKALELVGTLKKKDLKFKVFFLLRLSTEAIMSTIHIMESNLFYSKSTGLKNFLGGASGKEPACQCRRH